MPTNEQGPSSLQEHTEVALRVVQRVQEAENRTGRSEKGRVLAVLATKLEDAAAWADYHAL